MPIELPPERAGHAAPPELIAQRAVLAEASFPTDIAPFEDEISGVRVLRFQPDGRNRGTVLHFHGGGFRIGTPEMDGPFAMRLAQACGIEVVLPAYRLAPEHPFPAALHDGSAVFNALDGPIILSGASAGGGLAAALAALQGGQVVGLVLHSPWLDLTLEAKSFAENAASDPLFSLGSARLAADFYLQGHDPRDPLVSPFFANPELFPATLISVGTGEVLRDDATGLACSLGEKASLELVEGMNHVAVARAPEATGAAQVMATTISFIDAQLERQCTNGKN